MIVDVVRRNVSALDFFYCAALVWLGLVLRALFIGIPAAGHMNFRSEDLRDATL